MRVDDSDGRDAFSYSVCTLVTRPDEYEQMRASFAAHGFGGDDVEYLYIDNSGGNRLDAYAGLNRFLVEARGRYVVLCHQDIRFMQDGRAELERCIAEVEALDPNWAVIGNAGGMFPGRLAIRITDPHGPDQKRGRFPARVQALDENFLVVRRSANLALSRDLAGYHLYAADLCLVAELLGWSSYVVDFHLEHLSPGHANADFKAGCKELALKWGRVLAPRWLTTPTIPLYLARSGTSRRLANSEIGRRVTKRIYLLRYLRSLGARRVFEGVVRKLRSR